MSGKSTTTGPEATGPDGVGRVPARRAGGREWFGLGVLVLPCVLVSMDLSVLFLALPFISAELRPTGAEQLWIMDIYGFLLAGLLITMGSLGDRVGRRALLLAGGIAFGLASVVAAFSTSSAMLIGARALLGVAGATLAPATLSLIRVMFTDSRQRVIAVSVWTAGFSGGALIGPIVGGLLLERFWWGSVFLVNVPIMILLLALGPWLLPEYRDPAAGPFDPLSVVLSLTSVLTVIYCVKKTAADGPHWTPILLGVVGLVLGAWFLRRQRSLTFPMIDLRLFANRAFVVALASGTLMMFVMIGFGLSSSQYLQLVLEMRPFTAALWTLPMFGGMAVGIGAAGALVQVMRHGHVIGLGLALGTVGFLILTQVETTTGLTVLVTGSVVMALGMGLVAALATDTIVATAPPRRAGAAAALSETGSEFGGALGIALLGGAAAALYHASMSNYLSTSRVPAEAADQADQTLGGAAEVAGGLSEEIAGPMMTAARDAFTDGLQLTALIAAVCTAVASVAAVLLLGRVRVTEHDPE